MIQRHPLDVLIGIVCVHTFIGLCINHLPSKDMIWCGHGAASGWPRRRLFAAVRSAARTAQIGRAAVVLRKTPLSFRKSTRAPDVLSEYFTKTPRIISKSTLSRDRMGTCLFIKKTSILSKINSRSPDTLTVFYENILRFFLN